MRPLHFGTLDKMISPYSVLALLVLLTVKGVFGLNCFQCNSYLDSKCLELQPSNTTSPFLRLCEDDLEGNKAFCRKIYFYIIPTGEERVVRTCAWEVHPTLECYEVEDDDHWESVCQCFTDGCNAAPRPISNSQLFTVLALVISFIITNLFVS